MEMVRSRECSIFHNAGGSVCSLWPLSAIQYNWAYCEAQDKCLAMNLHFRLGSDIFGSKGIKLSSDKRSSDASSQDYECSYASVCVISSNCATLL